MAKRKTNDFWKNKSRTIEYARELIRRNNRPYLPPQSQLFRMGESGLVRAIQEHHGGFVLFRKALGEEPLQKRGMWTLDYTKSEIRRFMRDHGCESIPTQTQMAKHGRTDLSTAISMQGGIARFRRLFGEEPRIRQAGDLSDRRLVMKEIGRIMRENDLDRLPTQKELQKLGESSISMAITRYLGGFHKVRKALGEKEVYQPKGTWQDRNFVIAEARRVMDRHHLKTLPGASQLRRMGYATLSSAIDKYHGGFIDFRMLLGEDRKFEQGSLKNRDHVIKELKRIMREKGLDQFPSAYYLQKNGYSSLAMAVYKHHGGFRMLRESLGMSQAKVEEGAWKDIDFALSEAKRFLLEHEEYETLPGSVILLREGYSGLIRAITKYHGGFATFREKLGDADGILSARRKIRTIEELSDFLETTSVAKDISGLAVSVDNAAAVADLLIQLWPERFPSAADLARALPGALKGIGGSLTPFSLNDARKIYERTRILPTSVRYKLDDLIYAITLDQYQERFNTNPEEAMRELRKTASGKEEFSKLASKVLSYFSEVYQFSVPGHGSIQEGQ